MSAPGKSERNGISIFELTEMFPDEDSARKWFEEMRWPGGNMYCPHCDSDAVGPVNHKTMPYRCSTCYKYFSVKTGSVMHSSKIPLRKWLFAIYLIATNLKGISSLKLHRELGISQKTAWHMMHKIREGFITDTAPMAGPVEVDETFVGGKERNKKSSKRLHPGSGAAGKTPVVGLRDRDTGEIVAMPTEDRRRETLHGIVKENVKPGATVYTDEWIGYRNLDGYKHETVNHSAGEYVKWMASTNGLESFWSMLKRGHYGTYHKMSVKHLHRYVNEFAGRSTLRDDDTVDQMAALTVGMLGRRLRYEDLVA